MSEYLRTGMLERAASVDFRPPDLPAIHRAAIRRLRRRRLAAGIASFAAVALVAGTVAVLGAPRGARPAPAVSPWPTDAVTWAVGSTIHNGDQTIEVGHTIVAYVRTGAGFAFIDDSDAIYSVTASAVARIGQAAPAPAFDSNNGDDQGRIVADARGTLVGWLGSDLDMHTYDQNTGRGIAYPGHGALSADDAVFYAIDGRTGYWRTPAGASVVDLDTGAERPLTAPSDRFEIYSAQRGMLAFRSVSPDGAVDAIYVGSSIGGGRELVRQGDEVYLTIVTNLVRVSPTGAWVSLGLAHLEKVGEGNFQGTGTTADFYDTHTGEHRTFAVPGNPAQTAPLVWLDDVTLQVIAVVGNDVGLYRCTVPDGSCGLAVDLGPVDPVASVMPVMPGGRSSS